MNGERDPKSPEKRLDICTFLDKRPLGATQWFIFAVSFAALMFDGFDTAVMGFLSTPLINDWGLGDGALAPVMMSGLVGLALGALTAGPLADRYGRKLIVVGSIFFFGFWSLVSAYSWNVPSLCFFRFLTGLGLGASMPNTVTILSEFAPSRYRSWMITTIYCGFSLGAASCGLVSIWLLEYYSWRSALVFGGLLPIAFAFLLLFTLPESARFLMLNPDKNRARLIGLVNRLIPGLADESTGFYSSEKQVSSRKSVRALFLPEYRLGTAALWLAMLTVLLANYLLTSWLPRVMTLYGLSIARGALVGVIFQIGGMLGNFGVGWVMDRFEHHKVVAAAVFSGAGLALILARQPISLLTAAPLVFLLGLTVSCVSTGLFAVAAHTYPTEIRATGVSWSAGIGRLGSITGAGAGGLILSLGLAPTSIFMAATVPLLISGAAIVVKGRRQPSYSRA
ncbi:MAG: aromatic acid/H+ symport family MFS transporter [Candidatus Adiutrix sp.]|jgi:AAHS family 4-hydroxybenzoate transporter-like MFS transporter|nr:aromatic acid/H+ symport family MFS transporter [Candidatus Adiutrix sp.]